MMTGFHFRFGPNCPCKQTLSLHGTYKDDGLNKRQRYKAINFRNLDIDNTSTSRQMSGRQKQGPSKSH